MTAAATTSVAHAHFAASIAASDAFFNAEATRIADCCRRMAERFTAGGTLFAIGEGAQVSDAQHVSVEFVHPILVGKRALPSVALEGDGTASLRLIAGPNDMCLAVCGGAVTPTITAALMAAKRGGLLTMLITGSAAPATDVDLQFVVETGSPLIVQEVAETAYHVLWELVHVFLDAADSPGASFLGASPSQAVSDADLLAQVVASTLQKAEDIASLRRAVLAQYELAIVKASGAVSARCARGGRLLALGNGGSATDAEDAVIDATAPPVAGWRPVPALALTRDLGVITAVANDVGFDHVFARQIAAFGRPDDIALAFSTSGASRNLLAAMSEARRRGLLTIALSGGDGGALARSPDVDFCFTAPSEQLPRIQEAHATTWHALWSATAERLR
jgi:D-sedoheptulose 7-phosphate isomerase